MADNLTISQPGKSADTLPSSFAFRVLVLMTIMAGLKPEFLLPGLSSIDAVRQIPNVLGMALVLAWLAKHKKIFFNRQTKLFIAFFALMVFDTLTARNFGFAYPVTKSFFMSLLVYLATISVVDDIAKLRRLINIFLFCNVLLAILGILQGGLIRSIPALADENDFSLLMNMLIPFAFFQGMHAENGRKRLLYYGICALFVAGVVVSFSRGGFVGLVCVLAYCFSKIKRKAVIIVLLLLLAGIGFSVLPQSYLNEMQTLEQGTEESTAAQRIYYWGLGWKVFLDHPIIGVGPGNVGVYLPDYDPSRGERHWGRALHSLYFTLLSELGLIGVALFGGILYYCRKNWKYIIGLQGRLRGDLQPVANADQRACREIKSASVIALSLTGAMIGFLTSGAFLTVLYYGWFWMLVTYTVIAYNAVKRSHARLLSPAPV